jgi:hypothetical protein
VIRRFATIIALEAYLIALWGGGLAVAGLLFLERF